MSKLSEVLGVDIKIDEHGIRVRKMSDKAEEVIEHNLTEFLTGTGTTIVVPMLETMMTADEARALAARITTELSADLARWLESLK